MKTSTIVLLVIGMLMLFVGAALFIIPPASNGWDFSTLQGNRYQTKTHEITDDFTKISIDVVTADVVVLPATDGKVKVVSRERIKATNEVNVTNGTLSIKLCDTTKWYDRISFFDFDEPSITVYLPEEQYESMHISLTTGDISLSPTFTFGEISIDSTTGDVEGMASTMGALKIHLTTGDVQIANISAGEIMIENTSGEIELSRISCIGALTIKTGSGDIELSDVTALSLSTKGTTSDVELERVSVTDALTVRGTTGDISFRKLDAGSIDIDVSTGDVYGSVLKPMIFSASATTGDIRVPTSEAGGLCLVKTTTGDIRITVEP